MILTPKFLIKISTIVTCQTIKTPNLHSSSLEKKDSNNSYMPKTITATK